MDKNIGIKFIEPDVEMDDDDMEIALKFRKRRSNKVHVHRDLRVRENGWPDFILVERDAPEYKALVSTPPDHNNADRNFAYFYSAGDGATIYWIDRQFYMSNPDLMQYQMAENRLMAEGVSQEWARPIQDHGGCMLSIIGGIDHGLLSRNMDRSDSLQLKMVKVNPTISSFFSGIQAIITELELRTSREEQVRLWTVIGTHLIIRNGQLGRMLQLEAAVLFQILTIHYQAIVVVSIGPRGIASEPVNVWPANIAQASGIPIIFAGSALYYNPSFIVGSPPDPFIILNAPMQASCGYLDDDREIAGDSPAVAIVVALVGDMLTRPKVRAKLFIDNPSQAPEGQRLAALRPVSAKIRDYLDSLAFNHGDSRIRCVWNGLDPLMRDITQYNARF